MASNSTNKRRRTAADTLHITDLPVGFITDVSAYLAKPSRAILAVAFTSSSLWKNDLMHRPSSLSAAILSASQWDILDFEDVDKELANKLTDDDISAVLKCINAQDVLKRLKLCGCINITGIGLNPLRGSVVLEQIDISLVGKHERPNIDPAPKISQAAVVPILNSIISASACSLKYIMFPWKWWNSHEETFRSLSQFRERFNQYLNTRGLSCAKCNRSMSNPNNNINWLSSNNNTGEWMASTRICYGCLGPICLGCSDRGANNEGFTLHGCSDCEKKYCTDCVQMPRCSDCCNDYCRGCQELIECDECENATCEDCLYICEGCNKPLCDNCASLRNCEHFMCTKAHCADCYNGKEYSVKYCGECGMKYCLECKVDKVKTYEENGIGACRGCAGDVISLIVEEMTKLRSDNEELTKEVEELRAKVERTEL